MPEIPDFERWSEVRPFRVERRCATNACRGLMVFTGQAITRMHTSYQHQCDTCHRDEWFDRDYPHIEYEHVSYVARMR